MRRRLRPTSTARFSSSRSSGVVLRVSRICARVPATASTKRRVMVATPDMRCRKLRATRSAGQEAARAARDGRDQRRRRRTGRPRGPRGSQRDLRIERPGTPRGRRRGRRRPGPAWRRRCRVARAPAATVASVVDVARAHVLVERPAHDAADALGIDVEDGPGLDAAVITAGRARPAWPASSLGAPRSSATRCAGLAPPPPAWRAPRTAGSRASSRSEAAARRRSSASSLAEARLLRGDVEEPGHGMRSSTPSTGSLDRARLVRGARPRPRARRCRPGAAASAPCFVTNAASALAGATTVTSMRRLRSTS